MNNRGQFSIIAALLVAVILVATVIITYSTIRNSEVRDQPQILSAIDETNFAVKQILGFTVGYYGSVLQVTGNLSYAKHLALTYLQSGLLNTANMHPDWGTSFNVNGSGLSAHWFGNRSYSTGNIAVLYDLIGLGIRGMKYETSCKLSVYVSNTTASNQARLSVLKDQSEPVIDLGKRNFKFYRYSYLRSTWELVAPSTEPTAFANGTYLIDIPSGIDPYSYLIQVEDSRGIIVVASSFSRYTSTFSWNSQQPVAKYALTGSAPQTLGPPDRNYATLAEKATSDVTDYQGGTGTVKQVYFNVTYYGTVSGSLEWYYQLDTGVWTKIENLPEGGSAASPLTRTYNATSLRPQWTWSNLNTTNVRFMNNDEGTSENAYVDSIYVTLVTQSSEIYSGLQETVTVELLQNGTMRWLGQNLQSTTQTKPLPPIPVKAIHVNQTVNGRNQEVPFQVEDWNNAYQVPAGLTSNATVLSNRQMIVFLTNHNTSEVTIWWDGRDIANQTSYAYTIRYFAEDDPDSGILTNERLALVFQTSYVYVDGFDGTSQSWSTTGASPYLDDDTTSWISHNVNLAQEGWFSLRDLNKAQTVAFPAMKSVKVDFECVRSGDDYFDFFISDGITTYGPYSITPPNSYGWRSYDVSSTFNTITKVNNAKIQIRYRQYTAPSTTVSIRRCRLTIDLGDWLTSVSGNTVTKADFMRINNKTPTYGSNLAFTIHHGIVRDVIHQEAEWSGGITNCPNVYSQIVITLPANATYYTYQLHLTFVQSQQNRDITDLCPLKLTTLIGQPQTENGTLNGWPIVSNTTATFYNFSTSAWQHHWSQMINGTRGVGIMFTKGSNRALYVFDSICGSKTGALKIDRTARTIELLPVTRFPVQFTSALDVTWYGAVVTFDGSDPVYRNVSGRKTGLWIIAEWPPTVAISTGN